MSQYLRKVLNAFKKHRNEHRQTQGSATGNGAGNISNSAVAATATIVAETEQ